MDAIFGSEIWKQIFVYPAASGQLEAWAFVVRSILRLAIGIGFVLTIVPGLAIALVVIGLNFAGDELRDRIDPRKAS